MKDFKYVEELKIVAVSAMIGGFVVITHLNEDLGEIISRFIMTVAAFSAIGYMFLSIERSQQEALKKRFSRKGKK